MPATGCQASGTWLASATASSERCLRSKQVHHTFLTMVRAACPASRVWSTSSVQSLVNKVHTALSASGAHLSPAAVSLRSATLIIPADKSFPRSCLSGSAFPSKTSSWPAILHPYFQLPPSFSAIYGTMLGPALKHALLQETKRVPGPQAGTSTGPGGSGFLRSRDSSL